MPSTIDHYADLYADAATAETIRKGGGSKRARRAAIASNEARAETIRRKTRRAEKYAPPAPRPIGGWLGAIAIAAIVAAIGMGAGTDTATAAPVAVAGEGAAEVACNLPHKAAPVCRIIAPDYRITTRPRSYVGRFSDGAVTRDRNRAGLPASSRRARAYRRGAGLAIPSGAAMRCRMGKRPGRAVCVSGGLAIALRWYEDASVRMTVRTRRGVS